MKPYIYDLNKDSLQSWLSQQKQPAYRAGQILAWLNQGVPDPEKMSNLPQSLKMAISEAFDTRGLTLLQRQDSAEDGTSKYIFQLTDGNIVESVFMIYKTGTSVCVSSQAGCQMGCRFCASTQAGFGRNLTAGEMLAQVALIGRDKACRIDKLVVMGIGEPFENYEQLICFLNQAKAADRLGIGARHMTVSTCGLVPQMLKFAEDAPQVTLAVSLHAPNDRLRRQLMPIAKRWPIDELLGACRTYLENSNRRLTFEYALFKGVNDGEEQAEELARRIHDLRCHVNLIPANPVPGTELSPSPPERVRAFQDILTQHHIPCTVRRELGRDITAACGQLRRRLEEHEQSH
ncbi:23S rRNA (adenine(2503)-C(2))-methyltransferase RlmN [Oscillospiraceae bacterium HV4-5-C5C]|nr:23S rRNA (adenine(2503)-C(2))-methyltransferase RlmN [Oscillospiraceae bacterium HV4-5-C5C]